MVVVIDWVTIFKYLAFPGVVQSKDIFMMDSLLEYLALIFKVFLWVFIALTQNLDTDHLFTLSVDSVPSISLPTLTDLLEQSELVDHLFGTTILNHLVLIITEKNLNELYYYSE